VSETAPYARCHWRSWGAEAAGTALMVLAILLAAAVTLRAGSARFLLLGAIVAPCVALIAVSPLGKLSGAHINPAVTLGFWVLGRLSLPDVAGYVSAQLAGGFAGALGGPRDPARPHGRRDRRRRDPSFRLDRRGGGARGGHDGGAARAHLRVRLQRAARALDAARDRPVADGDHLARLAMDGREPESARSEGPALAFGDVTDLWIYFAAPCAGALVVALLWRRLLISPCNASRATGTNR
jgi:aquaporin Z